MVKGVCNNPKSYYFDTEVDEDFEPEECGMRRCGGCIHFYRPDDDPVVRQSKFLLEKMEKLRVEIRAIEKAVKEAEGKEKEYLEEILRELKEEEKSLEEQLKEFRRDVESRETFTIF